MTRCPDKCGKKQRTGRQTKPGWKKQEEKEKKKEIKRPTTDEEIVIARIVAEKEEELDEENMIIVRKTEEMVPRWFHKYLKVFEKGRVREDADEESLRSCHRSQRRICAKEGQDLSIIKSREKGGTRICERSVEEGIHQAIEITTDITGVICAKERQEEEDGTELSVFKQLDSQE